MGLRVKTVRGWRENLAVMLAMLTVALPGGVIILCATCVTYIKAWLGLGLNLIIPFGFLGAGAAVGVYLGSKVPWPFLATYVAYLLAFLGFALGGYLVGVDAPPRYPGEWPENYARFFDYSMSQQVWKIGAALFGAYKGAKEVKALRRFLRKTSDTGAA